MPLPTRPGILFPGLRSHLYLSMKSIFVILTLSLLFKSAGQESKSDLLCHKWRQVGIKSFGKEYDNIDRSTSELILFNKDGTFEKELYGKLNFKGKWLFNNDSTKLALGITEMNGSPISETNSFDNKYANDTLVKLTKDTLIDGHLAYFGSQKVYGHDDYYYV